MGIYMLLGFLIPFIVGLVLSFKDFKLIFLMPLALPIVIIPAPFISSWQPPAESYPYQADITFHNKSDKTTVYFSQFEQSNGEIIITEYCLKTIHWADFTTYDVISTPLRIHLTDNDNKFIYENRLTGGVYNSDISFPQSDATQP